MNLRALANAATSAVNPNQPAILRLCTGYATSASGVQAPTYAPDANVIAQVQDLSQKDVQHLASMNIQGSQKVLFLNGEVGGMRRPAGKGPDIVILNPGASQETWLVTAVLEQWGTTWCKVAVTQQL